ncbi:hypothetical protein D917_06417 [Trichinella nativa]|uniref:Uncharacterized protein n=1 Tax=Trichinella nativa TaxID=6335 RepID=A0A1Y3EW83_9BILA|nr:hypothetical protein D917_06417 [Trichinella nativa]
MASSMWYCTIEALRLSGTSAAQIYLSMRINQRSTSGDSVSASIEIIQCEFSEMLPRSPIPLVLYILPIIHDEVMPAGAIRKLCLPHHPRTHTHTLLPSSFYCTYKSTFDV